jgi:hypothetical protein
MLSACGTPPGIEKDADFVPVPCEQDQPRWLGDLRPEPPVDFLELASPQQLENPQPARETQGEACKTASNVATCQTGLKALRERVAPESPPPSFPIFSAADNTTEVILRATRGDEAFAVVSLEQLTSFLKQVNTPLEAMLLTQASHYNVECKNGGARPADDGFEVQAFRHVGCDGRDRFLVAVHSDGTIEELERVRVKDPKRNCEVGRRPAGLREHDAECASAGDYLAQASLLEAASVVAFRRLAAELKAHAAPARLIAAARRAARDEVRHAKLTARLAKQRGGAPSAPQVDPVDVRELEAIALENATEGCVREGFGALEAQWQALHASDPALRRAYAVIAEDELRHTALAWQVARWLEPRLAPEAQERVKAARHRALAQLGREQRTEYTASVHALCGVPSAPKAQALFASFAAAIA